MCLKDAQDENENSLIYIPCKNDDDEFNRLPSGGPSRQLIPMKQGSTSNVTSNALVPHRSEDTFTVTALESEGEEDDDDDTRSVSSRSSASASSSEYDSDDSDDLEESEDEDKSFVSSQGRAGRRPSTGSAGARSVKSNRSGKQSYEKILSSADELLDELMHADMSDSEEKRSKRKERRKSSRGKKSSGSSTERPIDMTKVETALSRIRSMGELSAHGKKESTSPPPVEIVMDLPHTNRNTTKSPIEMDLGSSKSPPPPQQRNVRKPPPPKHQQHSRPPPPPPPPPPPYKHGQSMAVLNPEPEPELEEINHMYPPAQHSYQPQLHSAPPMYQMQPPAQQHAHQQQQQQSHAPETHQSPDHDEKAWMKYAIKGTAKHNEDGSKKRERRKSLISGKPNKLANEDNRTHVAVKQMPYTDPVGDFGFYTGQVNENGRPDGKGSMKYDNGIFYEGTWTDGHQDEHAMEQYNRIRGGFTSWKGQGKNAVKTGKTMPWNAHKIDKIDDNDKTNVRGMEWTDLNGDKGRYTGEVNKDELPHGRGIMKYDFGLMAEGEWVNGVLKENPHDRMIAGVGGGMSVAPGMSGGMSVGPGMIGIGGMSVGPGMGGMSVGPGMGSGMSVGPGMIGGMSVGPGMGGGMSVGPGMSGSVYGGMPQMIMQPQQMMMQQPLKPAQQHAIIAQQNAMMKNAMYTPPGSVFAGGGSVYSGVPTQMMQMPPQQQQMVPMQQQAPPDPSQNPHKPPITEIKLG
jgi:hypothetical protein